MAPRVLLTGGAGFIGSHTVIILLRAGYAITVVDNLVNSSLKSVERVREIAADEGIEGVDLDVEVVDMCDKAAFEKVRKINSVGIKLGVVENCWRWCSERVF
jgi:UDP-glucose 4-epimerase